MLKKGIKKKKLLAVIILSLRTHFNNKIPGQLSITLFSLLIFPRPSWEQALGLSPWPGEVLHWRDALGSWQGSKEAFISSLWLYGEHLGKTMQSGVRLP